MPTLAMLTLMALALLGLAYATGRRWPRTGAVVVPVLTLALCAKAGLDNRPHLEWRLLPWPGYAFVQGFVLYALAAAFFGVAAARLPTRWNRVVVLLVGLGVLAHGVFRHAWIAWPEMHGDDRSADAAHHLRQSTHYTCGPAACVAAASHCGVRVSERDMAAACLTRRSGSRLFDLYRGLVAVLPAAQHVSIEDMSVEELLAGDHLVVCANAGLGHALCIQTNGGRVFAHDPLLPTVQEWTPRELRAQYRRPAIVIRAAAAAARPPAPR